jgi:hypothetical protein
MGLVGQRHPSVILHKESFPESIFWGWVGPGILLDRFWREEYPLLYEKSNPPPPPQTVQTVSSR